MVVAEVAETQQVMVVALSTELVEEVLVVVVTQVPLAATAAEEKSASGQGDGRLLYTLS
jgi:hypothetical protein